MPVHDHEFPWSSFAHKPLLLLVKRYRCLIGVACRLERNRSFVSVRKKNDLETPRSAAPHVHSSQFSDSLAPIDEPAPLTQLAHVGPSRRATPKRVVLGA